ncbi:TraX family protein [uncultured Duncaniella sp.]|uniref:TraX family protein n=1 Tax=uncultured Duncaniella sp. TaxID=2768039 RepID=UPI0025A9904C|nr:TraX family protein [uncultured Duncaniella sp.]
MAIDTTVPISLPLSLRLSGSALKILAVISMMADHCAYFLLEHDSALYEPLRCFGRIAFPVFAFLVAEGFANSRNRMRYFLMLVCFGIVSELPWYLLNGADGTHNVMFTLALGVAALAMFDRLCEHGPIAFLSVALTAAAAWWLETDYDWRGVVMIVLFYILRFRTIRPWLERQHICFPSQALLQIIFTIPLMAHYGLTGAMLAGAVIFLYDSTRGFISGKTAKYAFYAVYPAHLLLIAVCS